MKRRTYIEEARGLFGRFAERHAFSFRVETDSPTMLFWEFPVQRGIQMPITLGLQNADELNFGVGTFWSYFFPYPKVYEEFSEILDAWALGTARVVEYAWFNGQCLERMTNGSWCEVYRANGWPFRGTPRKIYSN